MEITVTINNNDEEVMDLLRSLHRKVDKMATDITQLENVIDELAEVEGAAVAEIRDLATQISELEVGSITQDQVDTLKDKAAAAVEALTTATTQAKDEHPDTAPVDEPPVSSPEKPVYTHTGDATFDETLWTASGFVTSEDGTALYYYSNDGPGFPGSPTGEVAGSDFLVYTGTPVVANS